jgi:hypothetical protein
MLKEMTKYKYKENIWITFEYNSSFYVGRTIMTEGIQTVACVSNEGYLSILSYDKVKNAKQLKILKGVEFKDYTNKNRDFDFDTSSN